MWDVLSFLGGLLIIVIVVEAITEILVSSSLLDVIGLRPWIARKALPINNDFSNVRFYHTALHKLLTCGYCSSVWIASLFSWFISGGYFELLPWDNILIKIFLVHRLANYLHSGYELLRRGRVHTMDIDFKVSGNILTKLDDNDIPDQMKEQ